MRIINWDVASPRACSVMWPAPPTDPGAADVSVRRLYYHRTMSASGNTRIQHVLPFSQFDWHGSRTDGVRGMQGRETRPSCQRPRLRDMPLSALEKHAVRPRRVTPDARYHSGRITPNHQESWRATPTHQFSPYLPSVFSGSLPVPTPTIPSLITHICHIPSFSPLPFPSHRQGVWASRV